MQTFLTESSFYTALARLDHRRLGKQRVEAMQIINGLEGRTTGWNKHPVMDMWRKHIPALKLYYNMSLVCWERRGFKNNMPRFENFGAAGIARPWWVFSEDFLNSHRSNLLRKDKEHYSQFNWNVRDDLPYLWPTETEGVFKNDLHA